MNSFLPKVSVIIPLYNAEKYIEEALNSIVNQTYKNLEIIVVNDGSRDKGPIIVQRLASIDKRIKLFNQDNCGQCKAANFGFKQTTGDYIKFFDADDILSTDSIKNQVESLKGRDELAISYIDYIRFFNDDLNTKSKTELPQLINYDCSPIEYITFHGSPQMYQCGIWMFNKKIFELSGLWDERLSLINDTEFFPRILTVTKELVYADNAKLYYRTNFKSGSLSQTVSKQSMKSALLAIDLMAKYVRSLENSERVERILAQTYLQSLEMSYPSQPKWSKIFERRLSTFPQDYFEFSKSGKIYNLFQMIFGWKITKRLQSLYYDLLYKLRT